MEGEQSTKNCTRSSSRGGPGAAALGGIVAFVLIASAAYAAVGAGSSSAAIVGVQAGNDWFCDSSYQNGICDTNVNAGDTVSWDVVQGVHTITECDDAFSNCGAGGRFDSGILGNNDPPFTQNFSTPGIYEYLCELHEQQMKGRVLVSAATSTPGATPTPTASPAPTASPSPPPTPFSPYAVQTIKDIGKPTLSGIALFPGAPDLAVISTVAGDLWRVDLSDPAAPATAFGNVRDRMTRSGDEGLLGVAFDPDNPGEVYINYTTGTHYYRPYNNGPVAPMPTVPPNPKRNRIARYDISSGVMNIASEQIIYESLRPGNWHTLNQVIFDSSGNLYAGSGDGGDLEANFDPDEGQGVTNDLATIIRIDPNNGVPGHTIPSGNPFNDGAGPNADQVWAYGLRNPWRISFDRATGDLWGADVGQWQAEEVNRIQAGGNYGWVVMEGDTCHGGVACTVPPNHIPPRTSYCNYFCGTDDDCAIIGGYVYRGQAMPQLNGWYVYADFCTGRIRAVDTEAIGPAVDLLDTNLTPVSFGETAEGELLIVNYNNTIHLLTLNGDSDGDGDLDAGDNCPAVYNPSQPNADGDAIGDHCDAGDADNDGYSDRNEVRLIGTLANQPCGPQWPSNVHGAAPSNNKLDIQDITSFIGPVRRLGSSPWDLAYGRRWDISPGPGALGDYVNIQDITALLNGETGYPPMFGGARAFGRTCPYGP